MSWTTIEDDNGPVRLGLVDLLELVRGALVNAERVIREGGLQGAALECPVAEPHECEMPPAESNVGEMLEVTIEVVTQALERAMVVQSVMEEIHRAAAAESPTETVH